MEALAIVGVLLHLWRHRVSHLHSLLFAQDLLLIVLRQAVTGSFLIDLLLQLFKFHLLLGIRQVFVHLVLAVRLEDRLLQTLHVLRVL